MNQRDQPLPPDILASALQDRIHPTSGRLLGATRIPMPPRRPDEHTQAQRKAAAAMAANDRASLTARYLRSLNGSTHEEIQQVRREDERRWATRRGPAWG
jgi:hypothetical protein